MAHQRQKEKTKRILRLIKRLYTLGTIRPSKDAIEYAVNPKTLTRNLQEIATVIPLINKRGVWSLNLESLKVNKNLLDLSLLKSFADNVNLDIGCFDLYSISKDSVNFAIEYKNLPKRLGEEIILALEKQKSCSFNYIKDDGISSRKVDPIRLFTQQGVWYLIAHDHKDKRVKTFNLTKIKNFKTLQSSYKLTKEILHEANRIKNVWASSYVSEEIVKLYVKSEIAHYVQEVKLHYTQEIIEHYYNGDIEISCKITHKLEILPSIKSWLPYIHILEPKWLRDELVQEIKSFLQEDIKIDT